MTIDLGGVRGTRFAKRTPTTRNASADVLAFIFIVVACFGAVGRMATPPSDRTQEVSITAPAAALVGGFFLLLVCSMCLSVVDHIRRHWNRSRPAGSSDPTPRPQQPIGFTPSCAVASCKSGAPSAQHRSGNPKIWGAGLSAAADTGPLHADESTCGHLGPPCCSGPARSMPWP